MNKHPLKAILAAGVAAAMKTGGSHLLLGSSLVCSSLGPSLEKRPNRSHGSSPPEPARTRHYSDTAFPCVWAGGPTVEFMSTKRIVSEQLPLIQVLDCNCSGVHSPRLCLPHVQWRCMRYLRRPPYLQYPPGALSTYLGE